MTRYAAATSVPASRSRAEIEGLLVRYGATGFAYATTGDRSRIEFVAAARRVRFELLMPGPDDPRIRFTATGRPRKHGQTADALAQEERRLWRALVLAIKAKLETVESGIATFEEEFLAHIVLPGDRMVGQDVIPAIGRAYESGKVQPLLPEAT